MNYWMSWELIQTYILFGGLCSVPEQMPQIIQTGGSWTPIYLALILIGRMEPVWRPGILLVWCTVGKHMRFRNHWLKSIDLFHQSFGDTLGIFFRYLDLIPKMTSKKDEPMLHCKIP
jgi:hypothetical protein